ncbi:hypothetical protein BC938DRAFT_481081 [Jimgerdemannia flammicorona]|uniref:Uncharacterized protein n=1 Tax=Jimgerdemannia flammicorona TaxID=994334 RepID=A0A433QGY0_9FUNG|nr:hypothetical protein BC938DRAFT_481081 [Jimgerdemannia flammicorona]
MNMNGSQEQKTISLCLWAWHLAGADFMEVIQSRTSRQVGKDINFVFAANTLKLDSFFTCEPAGKWSLEVLSTAKSMRPIGSTTQDAIRRQPGVNQQFTKFAHANSLPMHRVHRMVEGKGVCVQSLIADSSASSATVSEPSIKEQGDLEDAFATPLRRESKITHEPLVTPNKRTKQREEVVSYVPGCSGEHHLPGKAELRVADSVPDHVVGRSCQLA